MEFILTLSGFKNNSISVQINDILLGLKLIINIRNYIYLCEMCIFGTGI